jgi:hypothetical protein
MEGGIMAGATIKWNSEGKSCFGECDRQGHTSVVAKMAASTHSQKIDIADLESP